MDCSHKSPLYPRGLNSIEKPILQYSLPEDLERKVDKFWLAISLMDGEATSEYLGSLNFKLSNKGAPATGIPFPDVHGKDQFYSATSIYSLMHSILSINSSPITFEEDQKALDQA